MNARAEAIERRLELPLLVAALLTIPAIAIQQSETSPTVETLGTVLNWATWSAFLVAAIVMLRAADDRGRWLREHPLDVAIILLTPPFVPASLQAARAFRLLHLLRLVRAVNLARRVLSTEGVYDAAVLALLTVLGGGAAFAAVEKEQDLSTWDGVWWAVSTVTTVGYGDLSPQTDVGRIIAIVVMFVGIGFVAILTASAAGRFMTQRREAAQERAELADKLDEILRRLDALDGR